MGALICTLRTGQILPRRRLNLIKFSAIYSQYERKHVWCYLLQAEWNISICYYQALLSIINVLCSCGNFLWTKEVVLCISPFLVIYLQTLSSTFCYRLLILFLLPSFREVSPPVHSLMSLLFLPFNPLTPPPPYHPFCWPTRLRHLAFTRNWFR